VTGVDVEGRHLLRVCVLSFRTHADRVDMLVEDLAAAIAELTAAG
jgi:aromatic-L-amino-acid decarboxylase